MPDPRFGLMGMTPGPESAFGQIGNQYNASTLDQGGQEANAAIAQIQQLGNFGPAGMPPQQGPIENLRGFGANLFAQLTASNPAPKIDWSVKHGPDGEPRLSASNLTPDQVDFFTKAASFYKQALGGYAQEASRLEMQQQQAQGQPWQQLATALSANLAQQKDMPGWVQGLGQTAAELNPTVDQLAARKMAVLGQGAQMAEKGMAMGIAQQKIAGEAADRAQATKDREQKNVSDLENKLEDNYRAVQASIEAEVRANKRITPEQELALKTIGKQTYRTQERIEADLGRLRANAVASAEALRSEREFEIKKAEDAAKHAGDRLSQTLNAADRRQAQSQFVTAALPIYTNASFQPKDTELLSGMNKLDQTMTDFLGIHAKAGGPVAGKAARLMAFFGDEDAQKLLRDEAQGLISVLNSSGLSFARTSDKEMQSIYDSIPRATNNPKVALDTALRLQQWSDKVRERLIQERYAGNYERVAPYLPQQPLLDGTKRTDWRRLSDENRKKVAVPGSLEEKIVNLPKTISELGEQVKTEQKPTTGVKRLSWKDYQ